MTLLTARAMSLTLLEPLFTGLDLTLGKGDRIGLVAANGRGKSSLLRLLAGEAEATSGEITRARGLRVGHLSQDIPDALLPLPLHAAVLTGLGAEEAEYESWRADIALDDLSIPAGHRSVPLGQLSGGWQRLAMLARVWVGEPDVMLMDEPTNHLDLARIALLEGWIAALPHDFPLLIASHDRAFLDAVTNRTLFLRAENSRLFPLPYTAARAALDTSDASDARRFENDMGKAAQLRRQAAKLKNIGINSGSDLLITKTKQLKERAEKLEAAARPAHAEKSAGAIRLANAGTHAKALVSVDATDIATPDGRVLFRTGPLWIERGDRVVILGPNGAGKSTFLNRLLAAFTADDPAIRAVPTAVLGASDQGLRQLDRYPTPWEAITAPFDVGDTRARSLLAGVGLRVDQQKGPIAALSGGQKARLAMLVLRLTQPNFYVLDEPTNHLDIEGQEALEEELQTQGATCVLVSHDRSFVWTAGTRFWEIVAGAPGSNRGGRLEEVEGPEAFFARAGVPG